MTPMAGAAARRTSWVIVALFGGAFGADGCFNPTIGAALTCAAPTGKRCPDGFACSADNLCVPVGLGTGGRTGLGGGGAGGTGGTGGTGGSCANAIVALCQPTTASTPCDPVCQTGCPCGLRCRVTTTGVACASQGGSKVEGEVCQPAADDCAPGFFCVKESCAEVGRCHRYCHDASVCSSSGVCGMPIRLPSGADTGQRFCNLGSSMCQPVEQRGCPHEALSCYATGLTTSMCDCPSGKNLAVGVECVDYNDCAPGSRCLRLTPDSPPQCLRMCSSAADCAGCITLGTTGGICP